MAKVYGEDVLERVRTRKYRAALRLRARQVAAVKVANALDELIAHGAPDHFDGEEEQAFLSALKDHKRRMVGQQPHRPLEPSISVGDSTPLWPERLGPEDLEELANGGWPPRVQVWRG